jgi:hypothetical protein
MKTFAIEIKEHYGSKTVLTIAAKTFAEAFKRVPQLAKRKIGPGRYRILSITETAELDG